MSESMSFPMPQKRPFQNEAEGLLLDDGKTTSLDAFLQRIQERLLERARMKDDVDNEVQKLQNLTEELKKETDLNVQIRLDFLLARGHHDEAQLEKLQMEKDIIEWKKDVEEWRKRSKPEAVFLEPENAETLCKYVSTTPTYHECMHEHVQKAKEARMRPKFLLQELQRLTKEQIDARILLQDEAVALEAEMDVCKSEMNPQDLVDLANAMKKSMDERNQCRMDLQTAKDSLEAMDHAIEVLEQEKAAIIEAKKRL